MHARVVQHTIQYVCTWRLDGIKFSHMFVGKLSLLHPQNGNGFCSYNWKTSQLLSSTCLINTREAATCKLPDEIWRKSSIMQSKIKSWNFSLVGKINYLVIDSFFCRRVANSTRTLSLRKTSLLFINAFVNFFVILIDLSSLRHQVEVKCQKHKFPNKKRNNVCKSEGGELKSCSLMIKANTSTTGKTSTLSSEFGLRIVIVAAISRLPQQQRFNQMTISTCSIFQPILSTSTADGLNFFPFIHFCFVFASTSSRL